MKIKSNMKLTKVLSIVVLMLGLVACNKPAGELVGASTGHAFREVNPYGMVFIRKGAFLMGANSQSAVFSQPDNNVMVTVNAFWMDETEITNSEYRQFVNWVRDSIAYTLLIEEEGEDSEYAKRTTYNSDEVLINWEAKIPWGHRFIEDDPMADVLSPLFYEDGRGSLRTTALHYNYEVVNTDEAIKYTNKFDVTRSRYPEGVSIRVDSFWVEQDEIYSKTITRPLHQPKDILSNKIICVYPDTMVWARDFDYAYNDPLLHGYFTFPGYAQYPVVGVTWEQAQAFCQWRTNFLKSKLRIPFNSYRLPTEAEWEYAARGGRRMAMYPWGDKYARDAEGCFMANFKPYRGSYYNDLGVTTMAVKQFQPNDFGLYDMAGNVAEWTASAYSTIANTGVHDMNPDFTYAARESDPNSLKRKVIKGGSWKDISYYLQCGTRTYEYQNEARSYIGFRCVRSFVGND